MLGVAERAFWTWPASTLAPQIFRGEMRRILLSAGGARRVDEIPVQGQPQSFPAVDTDVCCIVLIENPAQSRAVHVSKRKGFLRLGGICYLRIRKWQHHDLQWLFVPNDGTSTHRPAGLERARWSHSRQRTPLGMLTWPQFSHMLVDESENHTGVSSECVGRDEESTAGRSRLRHFWNADMPRSDSVKCH